TGYGLTPVVVSGLSPGSHTLELSLTGYQAYSGTATVTAGVQTPVNVVLTPVSPTTGSLSITSSPSGATVTVDGTGYGLTPAVVSSLSPGSHTLGLSLTGYQQYSGTASVTAGTQTPVNVVLTPVSPTTGSLSITSSPSGATVTVDGTGYGTTPAIVSSLSPGSHTLGLSLTGYQAYSGTATVTAGVQTPVNVVLTPEPVGEPGYLTLFTFPNKAIVTVDGTVIGTSPLMDAAISPGIHTLKVSASGYSEYTTTLEVISDQHKRMPFVILKRTSGGGVPTPTLTTTVTQTPSPGETGGISVKSFPKNAVIFLNNEVKGNTPATIQGLAPGEYELKLVYPRYQTKVKTVTVEAGKITAVPLILMFPDRYTR
ncbi:MAG: PEGA domain-containing protein, partial [Methanolinea sp.]